MIPDYSLFDDASFKISSEKLGSLQDNLSKAKSLTAIALHCDDFATVSGLMIHDFIGAVNDYLEKMYVIISNIE